MGVHNTVTRGYLVNEDTQDVLHFQFNPEEFTTELGANYGSVDSPGSQYRKVYYTGRPLETFNLNLNFYGLTNIVDGKSSADIESYLEKLTQPATAQQAIIAGSNHFISPPMCTLTWGVMVLTTVVTKVKIKRKLFNSELRAIQLETNVSFTIVRRDFNAAPRTKVALPQVKKSKKKKKKKKK